MTAFRTFSPSPGSRAPQKSERGLGKVNPLGTHSFRVDPADLCLELRESDEQDHVEVPRVVRLASLSEVCTRRSSGEVRLYSAQCLKLVCLT